MNDIKWRYFSDEDEDLLKKNPDNQVIILTDVALRFCRARYIDFDRCYSETSNEKILKFAFIEE